ncbi:major facilitator superfamily domain-containing protein [Ochromonadaceae sp. CCMP2298]|nr:major facilitator superfamily domain-containing protein [Ochromonadaceae sp. CCMP2298]
MDESAAFYTRPKFLLGVFACANLLLFVDRGIVPGATEEFNAFIKENVDTDTPDVFLGLLQSSFIVGLALGSAVFGHMVHHYPRFVLTGLGCLIWCAAVVFSGLSYYAGSYECLVMARMLSGVGEASLQVAIPPWIQMVAPKEQTGLWLSCFYTAIPVGTALGYAYSALIAEALGWQWSYFIEAIVMAPLVLFMFAISPQFPLERGGEGEIERDIKVSEGREGRGSRGGRGSREGSRSREGKLSREGREGVSELSSRVQIEGLDERERSEGQSESRSERSEGEKHKPPTFFEEFGVVLSRPLFICLVCGYAAQTAMLIGLSTFGSAFMMGLGYFDTESSSSTTFGGLICISGVIATPLGGLLLDRMMKRAVAKAQPLLSLDSTPTSSNSPTSTSATSSATLSHAPIHAPMHMHAPGGQEEQGLGQGQEQGQAVEEQREDRELVRRLKMDALLEMCTWASTVAAGLLICTFWVHSIYGFLLFVTVGVGFMFFCTPAINMGFMLSVPVENQSFALAMMVVFMHSMGDVPSPIIVGLLKDKLAPGCIAGDDDGEESVATSDACRDDASGLRLTMFLVNLWLLWCVFFFALAWYLNHYHKKRVESFTYCMPATVHSRAGFCCRVCEERVEHDSTKEKLLGPSD